MTNRARTIARAFLIAAALALVAWAILRTAWVADDAYITLRTIDNWVRGHGLRWNVDERVQAYTHPLWMLVLAAAYAITREPMWTSALVGGALSLAAVALLVLRARVVDDRVDRARLRRLAHVPELRDLGPGEPAHAPAPRVVPGDALEAGRAGRAPVS